MPRNIKKGRRLRLSPEERQRRSAHMKAILVNRKALRAMHEECPAVQGQMVNPPPSDFISPEEQTIAAFLPLPAAASFAIQSDMAESATRTPRPDGSVLAKTSMFDVARYHRLKKMYAAKRKAAMT